MEVDSNFLHLYVVLPVWCACIVLYWMLNKEQPRGNTEYQTLVFTMYERYTLQMAILEFLDSKNWEPQWALPLIDWYPQNTMPKIWGYHYPFEQKVSSDKIKAYPCSAYNGGSQIKSCWLVSALTKWMWIAKNTRKNLHSLYVYSQLQPTRLLVHTATLKLIKLCGISPLAACSYH